MYKRPSNNETEKDLIKLQDDFLSEKNNENFAPAAKVIKLNKKKISKFAKSRNEDNADSQSEPTLPPTPSLSGTLVENNDEYSFVLGDIIEKNYENQESIESNYNSNNILESDLPEDSFSLVGYPNNISINIDDESSNNRDDRNKPKSLFARSIASSQAQQVIANNRNNKDMLKEIEKNIFPKTSILNDAECHSIHKENLNLLKNMSEAEILQARESVLQSNTVRDYFLSKKNNREQQKIESSDHNEDAEINDNKSANFDPINLNVLKDYNYENLLHFNIIEPEKLEWMKDIPNQIPKLKPNELYEARFDWKGFLLPYTMTSDEVTAGGKIIKDDRELYLHGDDVHRPGYTLQELFRLARSNIIQQRISAITAINGILEINNQGFYDNVIEIPISKIFFLLRFAFDDNKLSMLEITSKALSTLFYNETDEILLDFTYDCSIDCFEPNLDILTSNKHKNNDDKKLIDEKQITDKLLNLNLNDNRKMYYNKINNETFNIGDDNNDDDEDELNNYNTLNDFHLAETDLIECLLRTNIIERISYILSVIKPDNITIENCLKILIRLARTNQNVCELILQNDQLMHTVCNNFLQYQITLEKQTKFYNHPQSLALKLLRIIGSNGKQLLIELIEKYKCDDIVKVFISMKINLNIELIQIQIESFRIAKIFQLITSHKDFYNSLDSSIHYLLEWHYQFIIFDKSGPSILRQHAAAMITLINFMKSSFKFSDTLILCFSKWLNSATTQLNEIEEFSQIVLLTACINTYSMYYSDLEEHTQLNIVDEIKHFEIYLKKFILSNTFTNITNNLSKSSPLLSTYRLRNVQHKPLPNLQSIVIDKNDSPKFIITKTYSIYLINGLINLFLIKCNNYSSISKIIKNYNFINENIVNYLKLISSSASPSSSSSTSSSSSSKNINKNLKGNWFLRAELKMIINFVKLITLILEENTIETMIIIDLLKISQNILQFIILHDFKDLKFLWNSIIFNLRYYIINTDSIITNELLNLCQTIYYKVCLSSIYIKEVTQHLSNNNDSFTICKYKKTILPYDWSYRPLLILLSSISDKTCEIPKDILEKDIISIVLNYTTLQMNNSIKCITPTEQLQYSMMIFLGQDSSFLINETKIQIKTYLEMFFNKNADELFDLDGVNIDDVDRKCNFENLYVLFLNQFQATSYGDDLFSSLLMIPLQQKYDKKWRNIVWSEHVAVLRFINCTEKQLFGGSIDNYLYPFEYDETLLKSYYQAISSNLLRSGSIPYKIAEHHLNNYRRNLKK